MGWGAGGQGSVTGGLVLGERWRPPLRPWCSHRLSRPAPLSCSLKGVPGQGSSPVIGSQCSGSIPGAVIPPDPRPGVRDFFSARAAYPPSASPSLTPGWPHSRLSPRVPVPASRDCVRPFVPTSPGIINEVGDGGCVPPASGVQPAPSPCGFCLLPGGPSPRAPLGSGAGLAPPSLGIAAGFPPRALAPWADSKAAEEAAASQLQHS